MSEVMPLKKGETRIDEEPKQEALRIDAMKSTDPILRTHAAAPAVITGTNQPSLQDQLDAAKITIPSVSALGVNKAAVSTGIKPPDRFPDFAMGVIKIAAAREAMGSEKLKTLAAQVKEQLSDIDLLLDLSSEFTALPDKDSHDVTDKMRNLIAKLEVHKISIWKGEKITKEKLGELKAQISSHVDKLRTALQTKISTEIQPEANNLQSIMNIVQQIVQSDARLKRKTAEVPR